MALSQDLSAAASAVAALFALVLVLAVLGHAHGTTIGSRLGWAFVALAMGLFAARSLTAFVDGAAAEFACHVSGILGAATLPVGLTLLLTQREVTHHGAA